MTVLTQASFTSAVNNNKKFRARLELVGANPANKSGVSCKFYEIVHSGNGKFGIRWGRIGGKAQRKSVGKAHVLAKLANKLGKGYKFRN